MFASATTSNPDVVEPLKVKGVFSSGVKKDNIILYKYPIFDGDGSALYTILNYYSCC